MHEIHACEGEQAAPALPERQAAQRAVADVDEPVPRGPVQVVVQANDVDKLKNRRETQVEVEMYQDLRLEPQDLLRGKFMGQVEAGKILHLGNRNFLVFSSHEEAGDRPQAMRVALELGGEGDAVVETEGQEDGFCFEAVPQAEGEDEVQVVHPLLGRVLALREGGHRMAGLFPQQVLANTGNIRQRIASPQLHVLIRVNALISPAAGQRIRPLSHKLKIQASAKLNLT